MSVPDVVKLWNAEIRPYGTGKLLVSPSVTTATDGLSQLQQFFSTCGGTDNCGVCVLIQLFLNIILTDLFPLDQVDIISLHYYGNQASDLITYVTKMHNSLPNLPIWLSEYSCQRSLNI